MKNKAIRWMVQTLVVALLTGFCGGLALAQEAQNPPIKNVHLKGLKAVSEQLVRSQLESQPGQAYNPAATARDIRRLYNQGHFENIKVEAAEVSGGVDVTFVITEKRIVDEIKIMGNDKVRTSKIRGVLNWKEGDAFAVDTYDQERKAILKLYEEKGFANTSVEINVEEIGLSHVRVTFVISEGRKARVRSISFEGNEALKDGKLRKVMKTKKAFWFLGGKYNEQKFEDDLKKIVEEYGNIGRLEASVKQTDIAYSENGKSMDVKIALAEGPEYKVGSLNPANNEVYDSDEITDVVKVHSGDVHNKGQVTKDAETVAKGYRDSGYVNAEVTPQISLDRENKTTNVVYNVKEGDLKYVKEINVTGNTTTRDEVIRRDLLINPGERFDGSAREMSERRLENTHYFDKVRLTVQDLEGDDLYSNLMVNVEEGKTGNFNFGAGYSTEEKLGGFVELKLNNFDAMNWPSFTGGGQLFSTKLQLGNVRNQYNLSFTNPEAFGYPLAVGFDVFDESYSYKQNDHYREDTTGGQIRIGKALSPNLSVRNTLRYVDVSYGDLASRWMYTRLWRHELSDSTTVAEVFALEHNTLDIYRDPTKGHKAELSLTFAGLGGDNNFMKIETDSIWYHAFGADKKWILSYRSRQGWADEYGSSDLVPMSERFFAGGTSTVRGYENRDIGPKARQFWFSRDREAIGGRLRLVNNLEMKYKLNDMFRLYAFVDSGGVWWSPSDFSLGDMKYSAGLGFGVDVPRMGPIRLDYGIPLNPDEEQGSGRLHLMTGFRF